MQYTDAEIIDMFKALSNQTRFEIMYWLADPDVAFKDLEQHHGGGLPDWGGACVGTIQEKSGLSQSTISGYLHTMQRAGLVEARRHEKWTYYRVNADAIAAMQSVLLTWRPG